jgi:hypothetical protein
VLNAILSGGELYRWYVYLLRLRRLHPRLAWDVATSLTQDHLVALRAMLARESDLQALCNGALYTLARLNRPEAVRLCNLVKPHLESLFSKEKAYHAVGSALGGLAKHINWTLASELAGLIDQKAISHSLLAESSRINLVGRFLANLHEI